MKGDKRPLPVTIVASIYLLIGIVGFIYHLREFRTNYGLHTDLLGIEVTELLAVLCAAFLLRGRNWARWLAAAWMAFHVVLSAFHNLPELAIHTAFLTVIVWLLFRADSARYFAAAQTESG